ncbi:YraN family protein [Stomatohabitans albus]|uniref:YraN family protein n=1 Tax=Stomatohabitans albus TaxID=3110766 RepID=UPI00300C8893
MYTPHRLGAVGETLAADYLSTHGYTLLDRNWRAAQHLRGELDIVAHKDNRLVFVEVKTSSATTGHALAHITNQKCRQLQALARAWRDTHHHVRGYSRGDVIAVTIPRHNPDQTALLHLEGVW